jgi:hypothetical protein
MRHHHHLVSESRRPAHTAFLSSRIFDRGRHSLLSHTPLPLPPLPPPSQLLSTSAPGSVLFDRESVRLHDRALRSALREYLASLEVGGGLEPARASVGVTAAACAQEGTVDDDVITGTGR